MKRNLIISWYYKMSLKAKLMSILILFSLLPISIIGFFSYKNQANAMKEKLISNSQIKVRELSDLMSKRVERLNNYSLQILYDRRIYNTYNRLSIYKNDYLEQSEFQKYLQSILLSKDELSEILLRFSTDKKVFQINRTLVQNTESYKHLDDLYSSALKGAGKPVWYVAQSEGKSAGIFVTKIIYDLNDAGREIGLIVFKVDENFLFELFGNPTHYEWQGISIFDDNGVELFDRSMFGTDNSKTSLELLGTPDSQGVYAAKSKNDSIFCIQKQMQPLGWRLVVSISSNTLFKEIRDTLRFILLLCLSTIPICLILINLVYIDFIKPINLLTSKMKQIEKGALGITIESIRNDELGYVFRTFNTMSLQINNLINKVYRGQIAMKEAEMKALQAQINPHFLYNSLESINMKAQILGSDEISEMISALSAIIEANLNRDNENLISLRREVDYINNYKLLIHKRFRQKIRFYINVPPELLDCSIPKLIIQPIIENAVYHGLERKKGSGSITLSIEKQREDLRIIVSDDGIGIDDRLLEKLRMHLSNILTDESEKQYQNSSRIGIMNVHKRIQLFYGEKYGLDIESKTGEGTTVIIRLPYEKTERTERIG